jgi:hypothetical protein
MCLLDTDKANISYQRSLSSEIGKFWKNTHALSSFSYAGLPWLQKSRARQEGPSREFWWQPTKEYSLEDRWLPEDPVLHTKTQKAITTNLYDSDHVEGIRASRDLNHVEGIQVGETYMTRITLRGFKPRLESRWGDSGRRNLYDSNHVEGIRALQPHPALRLLGTIWAQKGLGTSWAAISLGPQ